MTEDRFPAAEKKGIFLFVTASGPATQVPGAPSWRVKRQGLETDHALPSSAEVKNTWSYPSTPHTSSWRRA